MGKLLRPSLLLALVLLTGCEALSYQLWPYQHRAEFAPPQSRWPDTLPSPVDKNAPPPAVATRHCYRTLAVVDCYAAPQPDSASRYSGTYPGAP
jgi:hypothetical protein